MARRVLSRVLLAAMAEHYKTLQEDEVIVPSSKGHTTASAEAMMKKWGKNEIPEEKEPLWRMFAMQFVGMCLRWCACAPHLPPRTASLCRTPRVARRALLFCAQVSEDRVTDNSHHLRPGTQIEIAGLLALSLGSYLDFWIIFALLMTNATLGFIEEMNAQARCAATHATLPSLPTLPLGRSTDRAGAPRAHRRPSRLSRTAWCASSRSSATAPSRRWT